MSNGNNIINELNDFITKWTPENCYIGITDNARNRLNQHNVMDSDGNKTDARTGWIILDANTEQNARNIESALLQRYANRLNGGTRGGEHPHIVYVYFVVPGITNEST